MAQPIYKLFMGRFLEAWYQLSQEEQNSLVAFRRRGNPDPADQRGVRTNDKRAGEIPLRHRYRVAQGRACSLIKPSTDTSEVALRIA